MTGYKGLTVVLVALVVSAGCADIPIHDVSKSFAVEVSHISEGADPIKLDFLWVVDNSASMCQEQWALSQSFDQFVDQLQNNLNIDIRLAVTTTDASQNSGKFVNTPAKTFPPACVESFQEPCLGDIDCEKAFGPGWRCKDYSADQMYNYNGSINSSCTFRCDGDSECCEEFCTGECGSDQSCIKTMCEDAPFENCTFICRNPSDETNSGCVRPPDTGDCPANLPTKLTMQNIDLFKCIATVAPSQNYSANIEQGMAAAWYALDPNGPNAEQSAGFLRDDAYLVIVFVSDEDDCSIHGDYCAPNAYCDEPEDKTKCAKDGGTCKLDVEYSYIRGKETRVCCGTVKKDYYNICSLLGEYKGYDHHVLSYDLTKSDCQSDEDCDEGWYCKESSGKHKCRPYYFSFPHIADYFNPPGAPIFSLAPVVEYYSNFRSLKPDPAKVLVAAINGDGQIFKSDSKSMISKKCLGEEGAESDKALAAKLDRCVAYKALKAADKDGCVDDPSKDGCESFAYAKLECIRQCYIASKGNAKNVQTARNSYVCESNFGKADFGSRYVQLGQMFGPNGVVSNICSEEGIAPALQKVADLIISRVTKICLPLPVRKSEVNCNTTEDCQEVARDLYGEADEAKAELATCDESAGYCEFGCVTASDCEPFGLVCNTAINSCQVPIVVTKKYTNLDGTTEVVELQLGSGDATGYLFKFEPDDCCFAEPGSQECSGSRMAITFNENLAANATIEVKYAADLGGTGAGESE